MGYKVPKQGYRLIFPEFDGLWVRMTAPTIQETDTIMGLVTLAVQFKGGNLKPEDLTSTDVESLQAPQKIFAKHLREWNLTEDVEQEGSGTIEVPVPATLEGVCSLPIDFFQKLVKGWISNMGEVKDDSPLDGRSLDGLQSLAGSIPMEVSLPNHPSW